MRAHPVPAMPRVPAWDHALASAPVGSPARPAVESLVREVFRGRFDARLTGFMPELLGLYDRQGELHAAVGVRLAELEPLYLERYLDAPIERMASQKLGHPLARSSIVEVGHLAARSRNLMPGLFGALALRLAAAGRRCITFTATGNVRRLLQGMGLPAESLGPADPARLGRAALEWGSYYEHEPEVIVGALPRIRGAEPLEDHPLTVLRHLLSRNSA